MITFNNTSIPQHYRPRDNLHPAQFLQPNAPRTPLAFTHSPTFRAQQQRRANPETDKGSVSMLELSNDLNRLKEQLKKLAEEGEQHQQSYADRSSEEPGQRLRPKSIFYTSSQSALRPFIASEQVLAPSPRATDVSINLSREVEKHKTSLEKRESSKLGPANNEIRVEPERVSNRKGGVEAEERANVEREMKELKDRVVFLEKELNESRIEKHRLEEELRSTLERQAAGEAEVSGLKQDRRDAQLAGQWAKDKEQYQQIIVKLQEQLAKSNKAATVSTATFDQAIRSEILKGEQMKKTLDEKAEELLSVRGYSGEQMKTIEDLRNQLSIQQLKIRSESNNRIQRLQIEVNEQKNEVQSGKRALECLDARYRAALKEVDQKDEFIKKYLVSRNSAGQAEVARFFEEYKAEFAVPATLELFLEERRAVEALRGGK